MQLPTDYQTFVHTSRYARWIESENRRETWTETVKRYFDFMEKHLEENNDYKLKRPLRKELETAMLNLDIMPSMRALATAGPALERCNVSAFNCCYLPIDDVRAFDELFYLLLGGCGVGFSVERQYTNKLPRVSEHFEKSSTVIVVDDSKSGWARALKELIALLYQGQIPSWDVSKVRPAGSRLKTFGGRASGPGPLVDLFKFTVSLMQSASGRELNSIECHDLCCKIAATVVVGGVRRSAMISFSNLSDPRMRDAKSGDWYRLHPDRAYANNSVAYTEKPDMSAFMQEWQALYESKSGERGFFNSVAAKKRSAKYGRRNPNYEFRGNPCLEVLLRPYQKCNLSEVVIRAGDTKEAIKRKVELAAILGTFQSTLTNFKYLRKAWKKNAEEERLLGVSLTGICDNEYMVRGDGLAEFLDELRQSVVAANKKLADELDIQQSTATTVLKPSGTVSQLVNAASGIHARYAKYYIRRVRADNNDPLTKFMQTAGVPSEPCAFRPESTTIFSFPVAADESTKIFRDTLSAIEQLELVKMYQNYWCEHTVSSTVSVKEHEWLEVGAWLYKNFDEMVGVSFLPHDGGSYTQAPYEEIDKATYESLAASMPAAIDWGKLREFEKEDGTIAAQEFACVGGVCELVDIQK